MGEGEAEVGDCIPVGGIMKEVVEMSLLAALSHMVPGTSASKESGCLIRYF